jgi:Dolichyl-phosphate-mannose-protein mannosyltransferase
MYSVVANEIVDGGRPYADAVERKPPLLFWTYAAVFKIAGKFNWKALHIVALVWTLCAMAGLYVIGRELFDRNTGLIAALFYGVFQPWWTWKTLSFDGEMLMNLPIILAWAIAFGRGSSRLRPELFVAGALLGAAFLLKQPAAIAAVPFGIYLLLPSYRASRSLTRINSIIQATTLTAGFFAVLGLVTIVLWKQGILRDAFYWTITDHDIPHVFWQKGIVNTLIFLGTCLPLLFGAIMACRDKSEIWTRTARCFSDWRCGRRPLLPSLLCSIDSSACTARGAVLCTTLVPDDPAAPLATATQGDLRVAGSHDCCILSCALGRPGSATRTVGGGTILVHAFQPCRQDFRLGPKKSGNLSGRPQTSCLPLHHNLPADGLCFRRTDPRFRYSQPDLARRLEHPGARFCQASADLHCRCSIRPEECAVSSEELSDSGQTLGGTIPAGGAHWRRRDLPDALGFVALRSVGKPFAPSDNEGQ